jgi:glucose/arabinose dehydrogenase
MFQRLFSLMIVPLLVALALIVGACSGGGSDGGSTTAPPPAPAAGSVTVTGTVSGTIIKVVRADTGTLISQADTSPLTGTGTPPFQFPFTLSNIPVGVAVKVFFFSAGQTFLLYGGSPPTNVFTVQKAGSIDLGFVTMNGGTATPQNQPSNVILGPEDPSIPAGIEPPPATVTVTTPAPAAGSVIVNFSVQNFAIGGQGQPHLHIQVDNNGMTRHFFNGQSNKVVDGSGQLTNDVQWQSPNSFLLNGLSVNQHQVTVNLATASDIEFSNQEANPPAVPITINSPAAPLATLAITRPSPGASLPSGPVLVSFTIQNFSIGDPGTPHLHIYLDGGAANHFFNGTSNQVLDGNGQPVANITWQSNTSFQITGLSSGSHTIRLALADAGDQDLQNAEANPPILNFGIQTPSGSATLTINSPAQGASLSPGPVRVTLDIQNSLVPPSNTQPQMHFRVDDDPIVYKFYVGPGIGEEGSLSGVRYQDVHTHYVHWKSSNSFQLNALASGTHTVQFVLVDQSEKELITTEKTLSFTILQGTTGEFSLQQVVGNLSSPVAMATTPDGRIFVNELQTGKIRVVTPTVALPWQLQTTPFATLPVVTGQEKGLLGIAVDPGFPANPFVYVYYTASGPINRVVQFTVTTDSNGNTVATSSAPTVIFDNIPADDFHNGGIINFGPDGRLYVFVGENQIGPDAQLLSSLHGKILRINSDGTIPPDNPFPTLPVPFSAIYSLGHRNSFGFTFHSHTNDLWETENGQDDNDQINRIIARGNYGWPICAGICNNPLYIDPIITFTPVIAPTGIVAIREDSVYPAQYYNNLLFADFISGNLRRIVLTGPGLTDLGSQTIACNCGQGALFAVMHGLNVPGQDGYVYVTSGNSILRVVLNNP